MKNKSHLMRRFGRVFLLTVVAGQVSFAQETPPPSGPLSLQQCIQLGMTNNRSIQKSELEIARMEEQKTQALSSYLPQVNGSASVMNNLKLQTSIIPGDFFGQPGQQIAVQFGTKYNAVAGIDASQILYDQSAFYAIKASKESSSLATLSKKKTEEQLIYDIASAYYSAQVTFTQQELLRSNMAQIDTILKLTRIQLENGFAKQIDVDRLTVSQTNMQTDLANAESNYQQTLNLLKYLMGIPLESAIQIPAFKQGEVAVSTPGSSEGVDMTEVMLLQSQRNLNELSLKETRSNYIPSLSMNFHHAYQFQRNQLQFFADDAWFANTYLSFNLQVPIFDGLAKHSKVQQLQIQIDQSKLDEELLTQSLKMQRDNAAMKLRVNLNSLESQQRNIDLAQKVYETTRLQYTGGIATMTDLVNAETSLKDAQTNYLRSLIQVKLAELELIKSTGNISTLH